MGPNPHHVSGGNHSRLKAIVQVQVAVVMWDPAQRQGLFTACLHEKGLITACVHTWPMPWLSCFLQHLLIHLLAGGQTEPQSTPPGCPSCQRESHPCPSRSQKWPLNTSAWHRVALGLSRQAPTAHCPLITGLPSQTKQSSTSQHLPRPALGGTRLALASSGFPLKRSFSTYSMAFTSWLVVRSTCSNRQPDASIA